MFKRYVEVKRLRSSIVRNCRRLDFPSQIWTVMLGHVKRCFNSTVNRSDGSDAVKQVHVDNPLVVSHRSKWSSFRNRLALNGFQGLASTISCTLNQRRWKFRDSISARPVSGFVVVNPIPCLVLKSPLGRHRECLGVSSHRLDKVDKCISNRYAIFRRRKASSPP